MSTAKIIALHKALGGSGSGGGSCGCGVTVVPLIRGGMDEPDVIQMKASELLAACQNGVVFIKSVTSGTDAYVECDPISIASLYNGAYEFTVGPESYEAGSGDDYPASSGGK